MTAHSIAADIARTPSREKTSLAYMPRLDGLRGIAISGVLVEHFCPSSIITGLSPGGAGVTLFFVLSGYLITRILLGYKERRVSPSVAAMQFYWRRFLRLSPPFYLAILILGVLGNGLHGNAGWHALYLTNFLIGVPGKWGTGADHFWSLATEEQFYLLWFSVVMLLRKRLLVGAVLVSFAITFAFRAAVYFNDWPPVTNVLLPGNLASLTFGSLLAIATTYNIESLLTIRRSRTALYSSAAMFLLLTLSLGHVVWPNALLYPFAASAFFACVVYRATLAGKDRSVDWLMWGPLCHVGKISYGIYVYHLFIAGPLFKHVPLLGRTIREQSWGGFAILVVASLLVAQVSWLIIERPTLRLKARWLGDQWLRAQ